MYVSKSARIGDSAVLADSVTIWDNTVVRDGAKIGERTSVGIGAYIGPGVRIGDDCKIQNHALIYEPAILDDGVFVGPKVIFTNDRHPRAINPDCTQKSASDWSPVGVNVAQGAAIGAGAICVAPLNIGKWASIAAGAVVTQDVPDFALVAGVPAKFVGWVGRSGHRLVPTDNENRWVCSVSGDQFRFQAGAMELVSDPKTNLKL